MSHSMSSTTFFAQTPAGGFSHADPRTGQQVPHQMHPTPVPWAPNQPLTPLGSMPATFDHPRTPPDCPPALNWSQSPYATIPLPRQLDVSVSMNPLLKYGSPYLLQARCSPSWATYSTASEWLREPATRPNMRTFRLGWLHSATAYAVGAVQALFGGYKMWAGLTESTTEPDVWVLTFAEAFR
ncbi:hypothetical protein BDQ17DRAFT_1364189 [Cyathus striatus]|nr:hypothetical protein BDQ17DRAFT_1364189 [Cyathus striatus]